MATPDMRIVSAFRARVGSGVSIRSEVRFRKTGRGGWRFAVDSKLTFDQQPWFPRQSGDTPHEPVSGALGVPRGAVENDFAAPRLASIEESLIREGNRKTETNSVYQKMIAGRERFSQTPEFDAPKSVDKQPQEHRNSQKPHRDLPPCRTRKSC